MRLKETSIMNCLKCKTRMVSIATIDDNWRVYKCRKCGYDAMKHIHTPYLAKEKLIDKEKPIEDTIII